MKQQQFLDVVSEDTARQVLANLTAKRTITFETVKLSSQCLSRVLAEPVCSPVDVPGFDRSNVDGFAVQAHTTYGADEQTPITLKLNPITIAAGDAATDVSLAEGSAIYVATGAIIPRNADAVVMIEDTEAHEDVLEIRRAVAPGAHISWAGTDLGRGEIVLQRSTQLNSRDTGLLAAIGVDSVKLIKPPHLAVLSTGDEIIPPGQAIQVGQIYDSNSRIVIDTAHEAGASTEYLGIVPDDKDQLKETIRSVLTRPTPPDWLIMSGGTSKGRGDLNATVIAELAEELPNSDGILVHGVALKPGKPLCIAALAGVPVIILPGFPTSAIFTFHEFIAPILRQQAGLRAKTRTQIDATVPYRINSVVGRTQYSLVNLIPSKSGLKAYPQGSGSGSVSTFSRADGYLRIPQHTEYLDQGAMVSVQLFSRHLQLADLNVIGSHCIGLDALLSELAGQGFRTRMIAVGSTGGVHALARGEGDLAGIHLLDQDSDTYNLAFVPDNCILVKGYTREQGLAFRPGLTEIQGQSIADLKDSLKSGEYRMINRNQGSGTRILIDQLLEREKPQGYQHQAKSHHAVAAAIAQGRSDWGMTLEHLAKSANLHFKPYRSEHFDFIIRKEQAEQPAIKALLAILNSQSGERILHSLGFKRHGYNQ